MAMSKANGYKPNEKVNQGPSGARKGKVSAGHGQNSDEKGAKDQLVSIGSKQGNPYDAKGSDFSVKRVAPKHGQGAGEAGSKSGDNELARLAENQEGVRHVEDGGRGPHGSGTPSGWVDGNRSKHVAAAFPIEVNRGESNSEGGEIGIPESVSLHTGHIEGGSKQTKVKEVPQYNVRIPRR